MATDFSEDKCFSRIVSKNTLSVKKSFSYDVYVISYSPSPLILKTITGGPLKIDSKSGGQCYEKIQKNTRSMYRTFHSHLSLHYDRLYDENLIYYRSIYHLIYRHYHVCHDRRIDYDRE